MLQQLIDLFQTITIIMKEHSIEFELYITMKNIPSYKKYLHIINSRVDTKKMTIHSKSVLRQLVNN